MDIRTLQVLEFPKLLAHLAGFAVSEAGSQACLALRPLDAVEAIRAKNLFLEQGISWLEFAGFKLTNFPSLDGVLAFLESSRQPLDLDGLWTLRQVLGQVRELVDSVCREETNSWPLLTEFCNTRPLPQKSLGALFRCLADDGALRDESSPELLLARGEIRRIHQQCNRKAGEFIRQYNLGHFLQEEFITLASDRYVLPLKSNFKGKFQGIIHDYSQTGETCYFEPMFLVELNNRLQELKQTERAEERKILIYLSELLREDLAALQWAYSLLLEVDLLQAKYRLGKSYAGTLARFDAGLPISLLGARHPLLMLAHVLPGSGAQKQAQELPVPTDISLQAGQRALILSGGNAGGKTVCLKTLGLIALMGMCSLPVPVSRGSTLPFFRFILPFIGDDQSLEDHVSTFTAQITQLAEHWDEVNADALVLLDEFGAGTDPSQGAALAQAVIDEIIERGAYAFAATHFPALKAYALSRPGVRAASVLFDPRTKKPLFRLIYDQVGASQALDVAREHGLPESVLKKAQNYLLMDGEDTGQLLERLNRLAMEREQETDLLTQERAAYIQKRKQLEDHFAKEKEKLFSSLQAESQAILRDWKAERVTHKQALKKLAELRADLLKTGEDGKAQAPAPDLQNIVPGATLLYLPWDRKGQVLEVDRRKNKIRLDLSGVTIWVDQKDLAHTGAVPPAAGTVSLPAPASFALRLDLRGKRVDVALAELDPFIDSAVLSGREQLEILHGRGTGALRREIHAYIRSHPQVASFALANEDQGGDGITLVTLK